MSKTEELQIMMQNKQGVTAPSILHPTMVLNYNIIKTTIDKNSIKKLVIVNPRKLHISQVDSIYKSLMQNKHFDSVFVVNVKNTITRIIDGNHRIEALKKYFEKHPSKSIEVYFATYNNLTDDQERGIFTRWNISVTQNTDDFINSYKETIPIYSRLVSEIPCSVYGSYNKMKIRDLINAYIGSVKKPYNGGESKTKLDFIQYLQGLKDSDVDIIAKNFEILKTTFNNGNKKDWRNQPAFKNIIFRALYFLIANNVDVLGEMYVTRRMRTALSNRTIMDDYRRYSGRRASVDAYLAFKALLNDTNSEKQFV